MLKLSDNLRQCTWRYAFVSGIKTDIANAKKGQRGICPLCGGELIPRIGKIRNWHWWHRNGHVCDDWYGTKGVWHQWWQSQFGGSQQECPLTKELDGETCRHIADVYTNDEYVIEFQYSHLSLPDIHDREAFYGDMVWVVCGTRLEKDWKRGEDLLNRNDWLQTEDGWRYLALNNCLDFNQSWRDRDKLVFFDFYGKLSEPSEGKDLLCLIPGEVEGARLLVRVSQVEFVRGCSSGRMRSFIDRLMGSKQSYVKHLETIGYLDKSVSYVLSLEPIDGWLIANGHLKEIPVDFNEVNEIAIKGRCAIQFSSLLGPQSYWWNKKRLMDRGIAKSILEKVPSESTLKQYVHELIGVASYIKKGATLELCDFKWLKHRFRCPSVGQPIWRLDSGLKQRIEQQISEGDINTMTAL